jgi:hypothetical protein
MSTAFYVAGTLFYLITGVYTVVKQVRPEVLTGVGPKVTGAIVALFYLVTAVAVIGVFATSGMRLTSARYENGSVQISQLIPWRHQTVTTYVVNPVGWQNSGIRVTRGQHITFQARGKVTIAMSELLKSVETRLGIERRRRDAQLDPDDFTPAELDSIQTPFDWVGPDGYGRYVSHTKPGRERTLPIPSASFGALVGLIGDESGPPERPDGTSFLIGSRRDLVADRDGVLWFNVNDVGSYADRAADYARIWFRDNAGFFLVVVSITG